jgi:hypothetical protein
MSKKIKEQYRNSYIEHYTRYFCDEMLDREIFPNIKSGVHKKFSNIQEKSFFELHENELKEYGFSIRRRRSNKSLPDCWDDYPSYVYKNKKSWKKSTKRCNQYYKVKEA